MKKAFSILLLCLFLMLSVAEVNASYWFKVINITPIDLSPNSKANFTVAVKGLGSHGAYVELVFRNKSQGLDIACEKMIKYVLPAGVTRYNCSVGVGDLAPGNYSFQADVSARGAPSGKKTAYVSVSERPEKLNAPEQNASQRVYLPETEASRTNRTSGEAQAKEALGPGIALTSLAILLECRWMKK